MLKKKNWTVPEVHAKVRAILSEQLGIDEIEITPDSNIRDDLGSDSLDDVELIMAFEEDFNLEITDSEVVRLGVDEGKVCVRHLNDFIVKKVKAI